jgi:Protein of unknown function (DUF2818)
MSPTSYVYFVIGIGLIAANLPFALSTIGKRPLRLIWRLVLLVVAYFCVGAIGFAIETNLGKTTGQRWEFYAITFALFVTFAFPGFVYRYLLRHK